MTQTHLSFETAMSQLEQIVDRLEKGSVTLEESIALYEKGESLKARCAQLLQDAEARIEKISLSSEGKVVGVEALESP